MKHPLSAILRPRDILEVDGKRKVTSALLPTPPDTGLLHEPCRGGCGDKAETPPPRGDNAHRDRSHFSREPPGKGEPPFWGCFAPSDRSGLADRRLRA